MSLDNHFIFLTEADIKREAERKEQERKKNQKIEFLPGVAPAAVAIPTPKVMPIPGNYTTENDVSILF